MSTTPVDLPSLEALENVVDRFERLGLDDCLHPAFSCKAQSLFQIEPRAHNRARLASARGTDLGAPAGVKPLTATIAPLGISAAASSALRHGYVLFVAIVSTSFELRRTPLKKSPDTLLIIGTVVNPAPYCLNPLEPFRVKRVRFAEDTQLLFQ